MTTFELIVTTLSNFEKHLLTLLIDLATWFTLASLLILPKAVENTWCLRRNIFVTLSFLADVMTEWQTTKGWSLGKFDEIYFPWG